MTDRYPSAVLMSALLHGAVVAVLLLLTYVLQQKAIEPAKFIEVVAGEGDNFAATEAPALGTPGGAGVTVPDIPTPAPVQSAPPEPVKMEVAPEPPKEAPTLTKAPPTPAPKKVDTTIPDFKKSVQRTADRKEAALEKKYKAEEVKKAKEAARLTKAEFDAKNKAKAQSSTASSAPKVAKIDGEGIAKGVLGGSTKNKTGGAGGKALVRTDDGSALEAWEAMLRQRLKENLEKPTGLSDTLVAEVVVRIGADGSLSGARISKSSGAAEFDQAVLDAVARTRMPARPDGRSESLRIPFRMRDEAM